jgi:hypothetical protein
MKHIPRKSEEVFGDRVVIGDGQIYSIISREPSASNAEFQHFIPRFNKNFLTLQIPQKQGSCR